MITHSIVIPVFNEEEGLQRLFDRVKNLADSIEKSSDEKCEVILVNDGSKDRSTEILDQIHTMDSRFKIVHLSRNFGHQIAITAGTEWAQGQTVTVMDADLQDPPELIHEFIKKWREGFEVIYAVRKTRVGETAFKLFTAKLFYRLVRWITKMDIPNDAGDFRLMDRKVVNAFLSLPERHRYVRGLISWVGFRQVGVFYDRDERLTGQTNYTLKKMIKLAFDGIASFSIFPLRLATGVGFFTSAVAFLGVIYTLFLSATHQTIQGWTSTILVVLFIGGVQLLALGVIGEYLGRMFDEVRQRPLYFVGKAMGFERDERKISPSKVA